MRRANPILAVLAIALTGASTWVAAQQKSDDAPVSRAARQDNSTASLAKPPQAKPASGSMLPNQRSAAEDRLEGEKRFHANCSRCHQYPHKFPPRAMSTIIRHMRVRATITDEDARLILKYMSQ